MKLSTVVSSKPQGKVLLKNMYIRQKREEILDRDVGMMYPLRSDLEYKRRECLRTLLLDLYPDAKEN